MDKIKSLGMFAFKVLIATIIINAVRAYLPSNVNDFISNPLNR